MLFGRLSPLLFVASLLPFSPIPAASESLRAPSEREHLPGAADSTRDRRSLRTSFKVYPSPLWSRTSGFAAGVGYEIDNLLMPGGRLLATVKPGQHVGRYTATYFAKDAFRDPAFGLANVYYETTGRQWFFGLGPASSSANRVRVEKQMLEAELRVGFQPFKRRILLQPVVKYVRHDAVAFAEWNDGALGRIDAESRRNLEFVTGEAGVQEGFAYGLTAGIDLLDRPIHPRSGLLVQASVQRYAFDEPVGLEYDQHSVYAYGYVPLREGVVALRAVTLLTDQRGDTIIPFYLLPSLHGRLLPGYAWNRFFGPDLLVLNLEYVRPLFNAFNAVGMDGLLSFSAGNVYDDLFDQFKPAVTFDKTIEPDQASYPLRPSLAAGFDLYSSRRGGFDFRVLLGLGTEGVRLVRFSFVHDLRGIELGVR